MIGESTEPYASDSSSIRFLPSEEPQGKRLAKQTCKLLSSALISSSDHSSGTSVITLLVSGAID